MIVNLSQCFNNLQSPRIMNNLSSLSNISMKAPLLRAPSSETHQLDQSEPVQAAPPNPTRSNYRIGVPRPGSTVSNLHLVQMRSVNWLGQSVEHLVGAFRYALPMEPNTSSKHKQAQGRSTKRMKAPLLQGDTINTISYT